jgi:hypothetical protein
LSQTLANDIDSKSAMKDNTVSSDHKRAIKKGANSSQVPLATLNHEHEVSGRAPKISIDPAIENLNQAIESI